MKCPKCGAPAKETVVDRSFIMGEERNVCTYEYRPLDSRNVEELKERIAKAMRPKIKQLVPSAWQVEAYIKFALDEVDAHFAAKTLREGNGPTSL